MAFGNKILNKNDIGQKEGVHLESSHFGSPGKFFVIYRHLVSINFENIFQIIKLCLTLMIEILSIYGFGYLQCYKYPNELTGKCNEITMTKILKLFDLLMVVPEGYNCDSKNFE